MVFSELPVLYIRCIGSFALSLLLPLRLQLVVGLVCLKGCCYAMILLALTFS